MCGTAPQWVVRGAGRVNLIGEHTDYNDGFVLPLALEQGVWIGLRAREDEEVHVRSLDFQESAALDLRRLARGRGGWVEYVKGVAWALQSAGYALRGWEGVMGGNVPMGAGLSSSAALEIATARAFAAAGGFAWEAAAMARAGQRAENEWVGVQCGIMDQMAAAAGEVGYALLIDCRSLESTLAPLPANTAVVVLDTGTRRGLVDSAYNERRAQCQAAAAFFGARALRDVTIAQFLERAERLDPLLRRRARHVISENERVLQAVEAMRAGDAARLGQLMNASHASLQDDFEVSSTELNQMVDAARQHTACYGARMTGAGFGGCAVALIAAKDGADFVAQTATAYAAATGLEPEITICAAAMK
ncbi:MAG: galactokinase [Candidatus Promineifilaceae bacterium]